jgi:hypothetical protein
VPTVALPAWIAPSRGAQNAGRGRAGAPLAKSLATAAFSARAAGTSLRPSSVTKPLFFHHHTWSITWPPIISAARSAETATLRAAGQCCFIRSPSVGTEQVATLAT